MDAIEKLSQMMIRCGLATGHGDTIDDLIFELEKQIKNTSNAFSDALKEIKPLQAQLKFLQDDDMGNMKTIDNLSKMAARLHTALDRIFNLHNSGDEYSEREINDMTYEIVVSAITGYDEGPRRDDRGDNLDGN
jgi:chromosome segregation ATPase